MSLNNIEIGHYCNSYKSPNPNDMVVTVGQLDLYFSYKTVVAYRTADQGLVCSENVWSVTTGRHLNSIQPDKHRRLPYEDFKRRLDITMERHDLYV